MTTLNVATLDGDTGCSSPISFREAWASVMKCPAKREWAFNSCIPSANELLRARENQPFNMTISFDPPSHRLAFLVDVSKHNIKEVFCTARRLPDGTYLGFVLNSACIDLLVPCFGAFEPRFKDPRLDVARLICGAVAGRLYAIAFYWLKSGGLNVRFEPFQSLNIAKRNELHLNHTAYAFLPSDIPTLRKTALHNGEPSDDFVNARFERILLSEDWYAMKLADTRFQSACVFCASDGAAVCGCPLPMRRRMGKAPEIIAYEVRAGMTVWTEFSTVKSVCANRGTVLLNVTKAPHSRCARVIASGIIPMGYTIRLNVVTSECLRKHLTLTGRSVNARRTLLLPLLLNDNGKRQLIPPLVSVEAVSEPITASLIDPYKPMASSKELISLSPSTHKRGRVQCTTAHRANSLPNSRESETTWPCRDVDSVIGATKMIVNTSPVAPDALSMNERSRSGSATSRVDVQNQGLSQAQSKVFPCPECGMLIKNKKYNLKRHVQTVHQKERKFVCTLPNCEQRFQSRANLNRHVSTVHKLEQTMQQQHQKGEQE